MALLEDPTTWTGIALIIFILVLMYFGVPGAMASGLDSRRFAIRDELEEARKLREEAQSLLATNQRKQRDAEGEVEEIERLARNEAEQATAEARTQLAEIVERRRRSAEDRITRSEAQASVEIRSFVAAVAIGAAREVIGSQITTDQDASLIQKATGELDTQLRSA